MRHFLASLIFVMAGCASAPARADDIAYNAEPLQQCIAHAYGDRAQLQACKGAGANPCLAAEGDSTMMLALCWDREANTWSESTHAVLSHLTDAAPMHADTLRASQSAWERWAEIECGYRADLYEGGSGAQVERVVCATELSIDRFVMLSALEHSL